MGNRIMKDKIMETGSTASDPTADVFHDSVPHDSVPGFWRAADENIPRIVARVGRIVNPSGWILPPVGRIDNPSYGCLFVATRLSCHGRS